MSIRAKEGGWGGAGPPWGCPYLGGEGRLCSLGHVVILRNLRCFLPLWAPSNIKSFFNYILQLHWYKDKYNPGWIHIIIFIFFLLILKEIKMKTCLQALEHRESPVSVAF